MCPFAETYLPPSIPFLNIVAPIYFPIILVFQTLKGTYLFFSSILSFPSSAYLIVCKFLLITIMQVG